MTLPLFHVNTAADIPSIGETATLMGDEGRHAVSVRRIKPGEFITLSDGAGLMAEAEVVSLSGKDTLTAKINTRVFTPQPHTVVTLIQALPKSDRSELSIELATEAGIDFIIPWQAERSIGRWANKPHATVQFNSELCATTQDSKNKSSQGSDKAHKGLMKWHKTAVAAAKQARRPWVPIISGVVGLDAVVDYVQQNHNNNGVTAMLHESAQQSLAILPVKQAKHIILIVGPEGGLSEKELSTLESVGAQAVLLGPEVLRTSTAAAVALGSLGILTGRWQN